MNTHYEGTWRLKRTSLQGFFLPEVPLDMLILTVLERWRVEYVNGMNIPGSLCIVAADTIGV